MKVDVAELRTKVITTLQKRMAAEEAASVADVLLWADMSGIRTQGIIKLMGSEPLQDVVPKGEITVERDTPISRLINAGGHPAPFVSRLATDVAIEKATDHGLGLVGVHNTFSSNSTQAFYAERIAGAGLIGIVASSCPGSMAPFGSIDPLFGTNPIGFSFPTEDEPLVFDMASSAMTWYGLVLAKSQGVQIPEDMAIDHDGNPTTDPGEAMNGALLPFDRGYKGSALGMAVEILTGPLVRAAYCDLALDGEWGSLFVAIDPGLLVGRDEFKRHCSDLIGKIKASRRRAGVDEIRLPGERARVCRHDAQRTGVVDIDDAVLRELGYLQSEERPRTAG